MNTKEILAELVVQLERIATALENQPKPSPDMVFDLGAYPGFDWRAIGAEVIAKDNHGAIAVKHGGKIYTRRNPSNKFGIAIWYSRATGKGDDDATTYERLITFKEVKIEADPLNSKTISVLQRLRQREAS